MADDRYSNIKVYDAVDEEWYQLTWRQLAEQRGEELVELRKWYTLLQDLDRCEHGRHEGDVCSSCGNGSHGNLLIGHAPIGHGMDREHIFVPPRGRKHDPAEWRVRGPCSERGVCPIGPSAGMRP